MSERRITSTVGTIPNFTALSGTVTSNTDTAVLRYLGSNDIATIMPDGVLGSNSTMWVYVPAGSPKIAKVLGKYKNATNDWSLFLDVGMTGASASPANYVEAPIAFSFLNDGGANGSIGDGATQVTIEDGEGGTYSPYEKYSNRAKFQPVRYVDASSTSFLIQEEV